MTKAKPLLNKAVLYLEDEPETVEGISDSLRDGLGLALTEVGSTVLAAQAVKEQRFELIILDVRLLGEGSADDSSGGDPRRGGLWFLQELRDGRFDGKTPSSVPVLAITCVVSTPDIEDVAI